MELLGQGNLKSDRKEFYKNSWAEKKKLRWVSNDVAADVAFARLVDGILPADAALLQVANPLDPSEVSTTVKYVIKLFFLC